MKSARFWGKALGVVVCLIILAGFVLLKITQIETSAHGVHTRLLVPAGGNKSIGIQVYSGTGDKPHLPRFLDGPVVRVDQAGHWKATWFCEDRVMQRQGSARQLDVTCAGKTRQFPVTAKVPAPRTTIPMPRKLLVLSDIEGNARFLESTLRELGVTDAHGAWTYGDGHLVIAGDSVDRGRDVFAVLWQLYGLGVAAAEQGGQVHVLLGNHDQYMLLGNTSRAHREHIHSMGRMEQDGPVFGADTVLGAWLRERPVVLRAGDVLVTHAGISAAVAASGLSLEQMNAAMRSYWRGDAAPKAGLEAAIGSGGVTQYRGYFGAGDAGQPQASAAQIDQVLQQYGARTIVVGHTIVDRITPLYGGRVLAIDVNTDNAASQALVFEDGQARILTLATRRDLPDPRAGLRRRDIDLASRDDWHMLGRFVQRSYALSRLPYPY